jgi:hypothetical protein
LLPSSKFCVIFKNLRLSQNFSFWESNLRFRGKSGLLSTFPKAIPKTNRVLGMAHLVLKPRRRLGTVYKEKSLPKHRPAGLGPAQE